MLGSALRAGVRAALRAPYRRFRSQLVDPRAAQDGVLQAITAGLSRTEYGRGLGIRGGEPYREFRRRVPVVEYEDLRPWIERQATCRASVLAPDPVVVFEETSGSSGPRKLVPYTERLLSSFDVMFRIWVADLLHAGPDVGSGRTFLAISPPVRERRRTSSGVPVGFDDDTRYLSRGVRWLLGSRFRFPSDLAAGAGSWEAFRRALAAWLVCAEDLEVMSVWSPTYLTSILDWIAEHRDEVVAAVRAGRIEADEIAVPLPGRSDRGACLETAGAIDWQRVWPDLKLISCWADGTSGLFLPRLRGDFPGVAFQPKGLLATEAPLTVPIHGAPAAVPLLGEVFFEFEGPTGEILRLHELSEGREYSVLLSQSAGLVRYRIGDQVLCAGRLDGTPCLRFLGRTTDVTDLVGEKLHERFVRTALDRALGPGRAFAVVLPDTRSPSAPRYVCLTDLNGKRGTTLAPRLEAELMSGMQYAAARGLGQLGPVEVVRRADARDRYTCLLLGRGMKWGDIKPSALLGPLEPDEIEGLVA